MNRNQTLSLQRLGILLCLVLSVTTITATDTTKMQSEGAKLSKPMVYQVMTRLFGNDQTTNKPWGTIEENGIGKFNDFTPEALAAIKSYGTTHLWYTGVPHHAVIRDYTAYGISNDDPDVVKGRAGSPYAVKDYYNVNPDLAVDVNKRLVEFEALIKRTHDAGMKVVIDIVPNHVARHYVSLSKPEGVSDMGENDDTTVVYHRDNNFYYLVGEQFKVPVLPDGLQALNGEKHPFADGEFEEIPAKWTGNGSRLAQPKHDDWFETVKVNYGVKPDGSFDFERLPAGYEKLSTKAHYEFWKKRDVPNSWLKFNEITQYWLAKGVDGFRFDMAEMVPVEFWSYLNSHIKNTNPDAILIAEVYNRQLYRDYLHLGRMDYLYDKVDFYDTLKWVMQGKQGASTLLPVIESVADIEAHMLHFLENHDEQRLASPDFVGDAAKGMPAQVVSALIGQSANLLYFGQAIGEAGDHDAGWGTKTRTTIFDYWGLASIQGWRNGGSYDGGGLSPAQQELQRFYQVVMTLATEDPVFRENYTDLHAYNLKHSERYNDRLFSFARWGESGQAIVLANFSDNDVTADIKIPGALVTSWTLDKAAPVRFDKVLSEGTVDFTQNAQVISSRMSVPAWGAVILRRSK